MAPGRVEDAKGAPFTGPAGTLLRNEFRRQGIDPHLAYFMNVVCCMPPNNNPQARHIDACRNNLKAQWDYADVEWVLVCGNVALEALMPNATKHTRNRSIKIHGRKLWVIYHPSYIMRTGDRQIYKRWQTSLTYFKLAMMGQEFVGTYCIYCGAEESYDNPPVCAKDMGKWRVDSKWRYSPPPQLRLDI